MKEDDTFPSNYYPLESLYSGVSKNDAISTGHDEFIPGHHWEYCLMRNDHCQLEYGTWNMQQ